MIAPAMQSSVKATPRVLVIDDDEALTRMVRRMLSAYTVESECEPGRAVERILAGDVFDVIVCDLHMPDMSGHEVMNRLHAHCVATHQRPIAIMITGGDSAEHDPNVDAVLIKPFMITELRTLVANLLAQRAR